MVRDRNLATAIVSAWQTCVDAMRACSDAEAMSRLATAARERSWVRRDWLPPSTDGRPRWRAVLAPVAVPSAIGADRAG